MLSVYQVGIENLYPFLTKNFYIFISIWNIFHFCF